MSEPAWGNPWHGRFTDDGLVLPTEDVLPSPTPANAPDTYLVRFTGIPAVETPEELAALGGEWMTDAVLYTAEKRYSPKSSAGLGYLNWLWRDANGEVWKLRISFSHSVSNPVINTNTVTTINVYARRFGVFGKGVLPEYNVLSTSRTWTNRGPSRFVVTPHLAHSPTGARTAITFRTGPAAHTGAIAAGYMPGRQAVVRAPVASMLLELVVTGLDVAGKPAVTLSTVVSSAAALTTSSSSTPGGNIGATGISLVSGGSTTGSTLVSGYENYSATTGGATTSTSSTRQQLMCGVYQDETLVPVWHRRVAESISLYDAAPSITGRFDWQYTRPAGSTGYASATSALRETDGFSYFANTGWDVTTTDSILFGGSVVLTHVLRDLDSTEESYEMPTTTDTALPDSADWFDGRKSFMTYTKVETHKVWVNDILVAEDADIFDEVRASWVSVEPAILSNNVFALCPSPGRYVEHLIGPDGSTLNLAAPVEIGTYGELACPSFNPRTGELTLVVDGVNGYV